MRSRAWPAALCFVVVLALLGLGTAHAAQLRLADARLSVLEAHGCGRATVSVRALDDGKGVVATGLPPSCAGLPVVVQVASADEGPVFSGTGTVEAGTASPTTVLDAHRTELRGTAHVGLVSSRHRAVSVVVDGWPLPARWLPSSAPPSPGGSAAMNVPGWRSGERVQPWASMKAKTASTIN